MTEPVQAQWEARYGAEAAQQLQRYAGLLRDWNTRINLVSRKDTEALEEHHLEHALLMGQACPFQPRQRVLDVGTGGGLPGLPLAILFPQTRFFLCDSILKKITAVRAMVEALGLRNVEVVHKRAETLESRWDFVLGRAVTRLDMFLSWIAKNLKAGGTEAQPNGVLYLKGSLYAQELEQLDLQPWKAIDLHSLQPRPYFEAKYLVWLREVDLRGRRFTPPVEAT